MQPVSLVASGQTWPTELSATTSGPLSPGASTAVEVYVTVPGGALAGEADIVTVQAVSQGDPRMPAAQASSALTTTAATVYGLELSPAAIQASGLPGAVRTYTLHLANAGNTPDEFDLSWSGNVWEVAMPVIHVALAAGAGADLEVRVTVPADVVEADQDVVVVRAASQGSPGLQSESTLTTVVPHVYYYYLPLIVSSQ